MASRLTPQPATPAPLQTFSWEGQALRLNPPARAPSPFPPASSQEGPMPALLPACTPQAAYGRTLFLIRVVIKGETLTAHFHDDVQNLAFLGVREETLPGEGTASPVVAPRVGGEASQASGVRPALQVPLPWDSSWDCRGAGLSRAGCPPSQGVPCSTWEAPACGARTSDVASDMWPRVSHCGYHVSPLVALYVPLRPAHIPTVTVTFPHGPCVSAVTSMCPCWGLHMSPCGHPVIPAAVRLPTPQEPWPEWSVPKDIHNTYVWPWWSHVSWGSLSEKG